MIITVLTSSSPVKSAPNTKELTITLGEGTTDQSTISKKVNIPNLKQVINITSNTGAVTHTVSGDDITITASGGTPTRQVPNPTKHSKTASDSRTSQGSNTNPTSIQYTSEGYIGNLTKTGTTPNTVQTGGSPSGTMFVTNQTSASYNSGGYSGTLSSYVHSGTSTPANSKTVIDYRTSTASSFPASIHYNNEGYEGDILKDGPISSYQTGGTYIPAGSSISDTSTEQHTNRSSGGITVCVGSTCRTEPSGRTRVFDVPERFITKDGKSMYLRKYQVKYNGSFIDSENRDIHRWIITYSGEVITTSDLDTRTYSYTQKYSGTVIKPASDTRVYRYQGDVTKPDTRTYRTDYTSSYSGTVYKAGIDNYHSYQVTIQYTESKPNKPEIVCDIKNKWVKKPYTVKITHDGINSKEVQYSINGETPIKVTISNLPSTDITLKKGDILTVFAIPDGVDEPSETVTYKASNIDNTPPTIKLKRREVK